MILSDVMDQLATQVDTIAGLRVLAFPADQVQPPAAVVGWPETIEYDTTNTRGVDHINLPIIVLVGKAWDRPTRNLLSAYVNGSGAASVKAVLKAGVYTAMSSVRVASVDFETVTVAGVEYAAAIFSVDIWGPGD
jgi:hypothetical protein